MVTKTAQTILKSGKKMGKLLDQPKEQSPSEQTAEEVVNLTEQSALTTLSWGEKSLKNLMQRRDDILL